MKRDDDDSPFNTPEEMRVRLFFLVSIGGLLAGIVLTMVGTLSGDVRLLAAGVIALALSGIARHALHRTGRFEEAEASFEALRQAEPAPDEARVNELVRLLQQWEQLERSRGSAKFDPWELQSLRHDIRALVEKDPALERLFRI